MKGGLALKESLASFFQMYPMEEDDENPATWDKRLDQINIDWNELRELIPEDFFEKSAYVFCPCYQCGKLQVCQEALVRCNSCNLILCFDCDASRHSQTPFHARWLISKKEWKSLAAMEFVKLNVVIYTSGMLNYFIQFFPFTYLFILQMYRFLVFFPFVVATVNHQAHYKELQGRKQLLLSQVMVW